MSFDIYIGGKDVVRVSGLEATYEAWKRAKDFAECVDLVAWLVDIETGEIVERTDEEEELFSVEEVAQLMKCLGF